MYDGDLSNFYKKSKLLPYVLSNNKMTLYIDDLIVQMYGFEDDRLATNDKSKKLGNFKYGTKDNMCNDFQAHICPHFMRGPYFVNGQKMWRVVGSKCSLIQQSNGSLLYIDDDEYEPIGYRAEFIQGFGYEGIKKRNELCLKHRTQIYNQIIEDFYLNEDLNQIMEY